MKKFGEQLVTRLIDITCDICNTSCLDSIGNIESLSCDAYWGYYSNNDGEHWHLDLCNKCANELKSWVENKGGKVNISYEI